MNGEDRIELAAAQTDAGTQRSVQQFQIVLTVIIVVVICAAGWFVRDEKLAIERINRQQKATAAKMEAIGSKLKVTPTDVMAEVKGVMAEMKKKLSVTPTDVLAEVKSLKAQSIANAALRDSEMAYVALNTQGIITLWSDGAEKLFGVKRENAIGYGAAFIIPENGRNTHKEHFTKAMNSKDVKLSKQTINCECLHSDGRTFPVTIKTWYTPGVRALSLFKAR